jgi:hypothetical protein
MVPSFKNGHLLTKKGTSPSCSDVLVTRPKVKVCFGYWFGQNWLLDTTVKSLCHIVSLQQSKIRVFGRVVIENPLNIFIFAGFILFFIFAIMTPT